MMSIYCDLILNKVDFDEKNSASNDQKPIILQELNLFGHMYIGTQKTPITDHYFVMANIRVNDHMYASEFEGLLCIMMSGNCSRRKKKYYWQ